MGRGCRARAQGPSRLPPDPVMVLARAVVVADAAAAAAASAAAVLGHVLTVGVDDRILVLDLVCSGVGLVADDLLVL